MFFQYTLELITMNAQRVYIDLWAYNSRNNSSRASKRLEFFKSLKLLAIGQRINLYYLKVFILLTDNLIVLNFQRIKN